MITKIYRVNGTFMLGDELQKFTKEYKAVCVEDVEDKIYKIFGSKHGLNRNQIFIKDITEISADEVVDPILKDII